MEQIITAKLKLEVRPEESEILLGTLSAFRNAMNYLFAENFNDKSTNIRTVHSKYYTLLRDKFNLPSQLAVSSERLLCSTTKTLWSRFKNQKDKAVLKTVPKYKQLSAKYVINRDITIKTESMVCSITTLSGRIKNIPLKGWRKHYSQIRAGKLRDPTLSYDKKSKTFYLFLPIHVLVEEKSPQLAVGIDAGIRTALTAVSSTDTTKTYHIPETAKAKKAEFGKLRGDLQSKGTRSARRKLASVSGRERRLISDVTHCLSKQVVSDFQDARIIMEDLTGIRERTKTYRKNPEDRRQREQWNFAELQFKIGYKSVLYNGIESLKKNPAYSSQTCPVCGFCSPKNRNRGAETFRCLQCNFEKNADIVAARNILSLGLFVNQPIVPGSPVEQAPRL